MNLDYKKYFNIRSNDVWAIIRLAITFLIGPIIVMIIYLLFGSLKTEEAIYISIPAIIITILIIKPYYRDFKYIINFLEKCRDNEYSKIPEIESSEYLENLLSKIIELNEVSFNRKKLLEEKVEEWKILFNSIPDIIILLDNDIKIVRINNSAKEFFGKNIYNKPFERVIDNKLLLSFIRQTMYDNLNRAIEISYLKNDIEYWFYIKIEKFSSQTDYKAEIILSLHDMTKQKSLEKAQADFIANASHEIRTPLTGLKGMIETLQTTAKDDPVASEYFLNSMGRQVDRLASLVTDLLSLSKIEMSSYIFPEKIHKITDLIDTSINDINWLAKENNVEIIKEYLAENVELYAYENHIIQLFTNLISNAIKYGHSNSTVKIIVTNETIDPQEMVNFRGKTQAIKIEVIDQGEGIPEEHISRLTERFYMVSNSRARTGKVTGTGLGLAIVKQIVYAHHGELKITSKIGEGSNFTVYLPVAV